MSSVRDSLRNSVPTARVPKFDWKAGENFNFELWYLNDAPEAVSDTVRATLTIGDQVIELANWETGDVGACENKQGAKIVRELPWVDAKDMTLPLESANGNTNAYRLMYKA